MSEGIAALPVLDLLRLQARAVGELRRRGVVRTNNNPTGDYAEHLFISAFGWDLQTNSKSGYDAEDGDGHRYQIKSRRITATNRSRQLNVIRGHELNKFHILAVVLFDASFAVMRAGLLPHEFVPLFGRLSAHQNGLVVHAEDRFFAHEACVDVTEELRAQQLREG